MTLEWWQALLLGVLQGVTEFLPVSSSGHLVLVPYVASWPAPGLAFDAAVHGGTAGALVAVFRRELTAMARGLAGGSDVDAHLARRLAGLVALGTVPLVVVGLTVRRTVEAAFESPPAAATGLLATAVILLAGERWRQRRVGQASSARVDAGPGEAPERSDGAHASGEPAARAPADDATPRARAIVTGDDAEDPAGATLDRLGPRAALLIGVGQTLAVLPGVSRSGTTIMSGVAAGLTREAAARFAFLLALPALAGAIALSGIELATGGAGTLGWAGLMGAIAAAFVSGLAAVSWLLRLVAHTSLTGFAGYCVAAGVAGWLAIALLGAGPGAG